jgi:hypothetical protein
MKSNKTRYMNIVCLITILYRGDGKSLARPTSCCMRVASHTGTNTVSVPVADSVSKNVQFIMSVSDTMIIPNTYRALPSQITLVSKYLVKLIAD